MPSCTQCQESSSSVKPRRVSAVFCPLESSLSDTSPPLEDAPEPLPLAPVWWKDWPRYQLHVLPPTHRLHPLALLSRLRCKQEFPPGTKEGRDITHIPQKD